jgi:GT2 family glycosyltransferase
MKSGTCLGGGATVAFETRDPFMRLFLWTWTALSRINKWAAGSFIFCEAAAFRALGGFDEELYASEEIDFSRRLKRLARSRGREIVILHRHPLLSSDRKARLYSLREHLVFFAKFLFLRRRALRSRDACHIWYDGRR